MAEAVTHAQWDAAVLILGVLGIFIRFQMLSNASHSSSVTVSSSQVPVASSRHSQMLRQFNEDIFKRNVLTDVEVVVEGQTFKSHRVVLVCFSPALKKKLISADGKPIAKKVTIPRICNKDFEVLLHYMYTGDLNVTCNNFFEVYKAASILEMQDVMQECLQLLEPRDDIRTYYYIYVTAKKMDAQTNWLRALRLLTHRFEEAICVPEFLQLDLGCVVELLSAQNIGARSEVLVFLAALNWLNHDYVGRQDYALKVMECVRFSSMTMDEIVACYHPPFLPQLLNKPEIVTLLFRATCYITAKFLGQEAWFKNYSCPKRNLAFESLPMELWHKKKPNDISEIDACTWHWKKSTNSKKTFERPNIPKTETGVSDFSSDYNTDTNGTKRNENRNQDSDYFLPATNDEKYSTHLQKKQRLRDLQEFSEVKDGKQRIPTNLNETLKKIFRQCARSPEDEVSVAEIVKNVLHESNEQGSRENYLVKGKPAENQHEIDFLQAGKERGTSSQRPLNQTSPLKVHSSHSFQSPTERDLPSRKKHRKVSYIQVPPHTLIADQKELSPSSSNCDQKRQFQARNNSKESFHGLTELFRSFSNPRKLIDEIHEVKKEKGSSNQGQSNQKLASVVHSSPSVSYAIQQDFSVRKEPGHVSDVLGAPLSLIKEKSEFFQNNFKLDKAGIHETRASAKSPHDLAEEFESCKAPEKNVDVSHEAGKKKVLSREKPTNQAVPLKINSSQNVHYSAQRDNPVKKEHECVSDVQELPQSAVKEGRHFSQSNLNLERKLDPPAKKDITGTPEDTKDAFGSPRDTKQLNTSPRQTKKPILTKVSVATTEHALHPRNLPTKEPAHVAEQMKASIFPGQHKQSARKLSILDQPVHEVKGNEVLGHEIDNRPSTRGPLILSRSKVHIHEEEDPSLGVQRSPSRSRKDKPSILIIGGINPQKLKTIGIGGEILSFNPKKNKWMRFNTLPAPRHNHTAAFWNDCLYVIGGCDPLETLQQNRYIAKRSCYKLDLSRQQWTTIQDMKFKRYDHGLALTSGQIYVIGGQEDGERLLKTAEVYDIKKDKWKILPSEMCCGRKAMGASAFSGRIWIAGGLVQPDKEINLHVVSHVDCYDLKQKRWLFKVHSLPSPRCFCSLTVWRDKVCCIGGMVRQNREEMRPTDEVWFFNNETELWEEGPNLPISRMGSVALVYDSNLYAVGGFDPDANAGIRNVNYLVPGAISWDIAAALPSHLFGLAAVACSEIASL